jgi:DNA-binding transcriptional LysR family regulator
MSIRAEGPDLRRPRTKLDNLLAVATVAEKRDYSGAAEELGLTASAVRKQVETVESLLGGRLFDGKKGNLTLTEDGDIFRGDARRSIEYALLAEEKVLMRLALRNHHLYIGHSTYLPPQLITLIRRIGVEGQPPVHLDHVSGLTSNLVQRVLEGSLHAAVVLLPVSSSELLIRAVFEEPVVVCLGNNRPTCGRWAWM